MILAPYDFLMGVITLVGTIFWVFLPTVTYLVTACLKWSIALFALRLLQQHCALSFTLVEILVTLPACILFPHCFIALLIAQYFIILITVSRRAS